MRRGLQFQQTAAPPRPRHRQMASGPLPEASMFDRTTRGLPGGNATVDVTGVDASLPRRLDRHGGAFAVGTEEDDPPVDPERPQQSARFEIVPQLRIGFVQRARNGAVPLALRLLPEVDEDDIGL